MEVSLESPKELANRTGWPERRIRTLISSKQLRHLRIGGVILVPLGAIEEYIETNMVKPCRSMVDNDRNPSHSTSKKRVAQDAQR